MIRLGKLRLPRPPIRQYVFLVRKVLLFLRLDLLYPLFEDSLECQLLNALEDFFVMLLYRFLVVQAYLSRLNCGDEICFFFAWTRGWTLFQIGQPLLFALFVRKPNRRARLNRWQLDIGGIRATNCLDKERRRSDWKMA